MKKPTKAEELLYTFRQDYLIPDADSLVSSTEIADAVEEHWPDFDRSFLLSPRFAEIVCKGLRAFHDDNENYFIEAIGDGLNVRFRARFVDDLGFESFDPSGEKINVEYLVADLLPIEGVHMFVALPERLKSWLAYRIAIDVSQGNMVLGRFVSKRGRAAIVDFEVGIIEVKRRLKMLGADGRIFVKSFPKFDLTQEQFWIELAKIQPQFVVIDGLGAGQTGIGEQDSRFADPLGRAMKFAEQFHCTFLFLHHSTKASSLADVESMFSGTGAIRRKVDSAYYFHRPAGRDVAEVIPVKTRKGVEAERFAIQLSDDRGLELVKSGCDEQPLETPVTVDERILRAIEARGAPGISGSALSVDLEIRKETVLEACTRLRDAGQITVVGGGRSRRFVLVESVPGAVPGAVSGTDGCTDRK